MNYELKSEYIKQMISNPDKDYGDIKDYSKLNFSKIVEFVLNGASEKDVQDICSDINSGKVKFGMDSKTVKLIIENQDNENIKGLLKSINKSMSIDVNGLRELGSEDFQKIQAMGCNIDRVYVNSGYDEAAKRGYDVGVYKRIITGAEKMVEDALKKLPEDATEQDRFMAIYNIVLKNCTYDYSVVEGEASANGRSIGRKTDTSRNLEGFFVDETSVCAGTADALKQLCELNGIEAEYVQGQASTSQDVESSCHAWVKVKLDGKWYNADPTWDANKVGKPYEFCLKSDSDFRGHNQNNNYQPTYRRDDKGRAVSVSRADHYSSNDSLDSSYLESKYYTSNLASMSKDGRFIDPRRTMGLGERPDNAGIVARSNSFLELIINAILNFGRWSKEKVGHIFRKNNISKNDIEKISNDDKAKAYAKSLHVDLDKATIQKSLDVENNQKESSRDDKSR